MADVVMVFTFRSTERILREGGSQAWKLKHGAKGAKYLICTQNRHSQYGDGEAEHGTAFLVGRISEVVESPEGRDGRFLIRISHYATIDIPSAWKGWRFPVRFLSFEELESLGIHIDFGGLDFRPLPGERAEPHTPEGGGSGVQPLSIDEAKRRLAATFGVSPSAVEIVIRA